VKFADLHIHSNFSDSSCNLRDIFKRAYQEGLSCISIVDHDALDAYSTKEIDELSQEYSLEYIKGVELSSQLGGEEVHLLGYFPKGEVSDTFLNILKQLKEDRLRRILEMIDLLNNLGIKLDKEEFKEFVGSASLSRLHLAVFLKYKKVVRDIKEAFSKYLAEGRPAYICRFRYSFEKGLSLLKSAKALVFLAHPINFSDSQIESLIKLGLDGIETFYPNYSPETIANYQRLASKHNLLISGGSDSHGEYKDNTYIGKIKLPYFYVERIKNAF